MTGIAYYAAPGGALVHRFVVKRDIEKIFAFRQRRLDEIFAEHSN